MSALPKPLLANGVTLPAGDPRIPSGKLLQMREELQEHRVCPYVLWTVLPDGKLWVIDGPVRAKLVDVASVELLAAGYSLDFGSARA